MEHIEGMKSAKPRSSSKVTRYTDLHEVDKKRVFVAAIILAVVLAGGLMLAKNTLPAFIAQQEKKAQEKLEEKGDVAGEIDINFDGLQNQIDEIKKNVAEIKVEDVKEQQAVKKILNDLDGLVKKASESAKVLDVKGNLCEEVKKKFCQ